jgi:transcriptional regulator with GAF, ATPase, and Fis domain
VQRAIPPDLTHAGHPALSGALQHEAVGDLHLAADNSSGAAEAFSAALRDMGPGFPRERCRVLSKLAESYIRRSEYHAALAPLREARGTARVLDDGRVLAGIAARFADAYTELGQYARGRRFARYAYRVLRDTDDHRTVGQAGVRLGICCARLGRMTEAIEWLQNAAATFRRIDDTDGLVVALNNLGIVHKNLRNWREAIHFFEEALGLDQDKGLFSPARAHHQNLGLIRYRLGQWDLAEEDFRQSLRIARETGHQQGEAAAYLALGMMCRRRRQFERSEEHFRHALALAAEVGARRETTLAREFLGELELDRGNAEGAYALLSPALEDARRLAPQGDLVAELETRTGLACLHLDRAEEAEEHLARGAALADRLGDRVERAFAERALARLDAVRGDAMAMAAKLRASAQCFDELGETYELAMTLSAHGEYLFLLPASTRMRVPLEPVADAAKRAATLYRQLGVTSLAAEAVLIMSRLEAEREHYDQALSLLEQAEQWLAETGESETRDRAETLRRELERQYVAVSISTCNEFRALEEANRLFRETADMDGLLSQAVRLAVDHAGGDRGFVAFSASGGRLDVVAQHGLGRDRARRILRVVEGAIGSRITESGPLFSSRVAADPRFGAALADTLEGVGSLVCVPLNFPSQALGLVYVDRLNDSLLGPFKQRDLNLLAVLANSTAVAIVEAQRSLLLEENRQLRDKLRPSPGSERVISQSREMSSIMNLLAKVGSSQATVLFMGETGTGKGLLAQVVHEISGRRDRPFVQVNCAALPETLLESELFGYVKGAFTGATQDKSGLFEEAEGGTIFLDEIEKVPESVQAKLLHVLDRGEIRPVGATRNKRVNARVICATCGDLRDRIKEGRFLEDLYYRLNDITVRVPSLRERREDIPVLAEHFLAFYTRQMEKTVRGFSPGVMQVFLDHPWRGNVRELEKTVKRMVVLAETGAVLDRDLLPAEFRETETAPAADRPNGKLLRSNISQLERRMIAEALDRCRWNKARTARELGLSYPTLLSKIRSLQIERRKRF